MTAIVLFPILSSHTLIRSSRTESSSGLCLQWEGGTPHAKPVASYSSWAQSSIWGWVWTQIRPKQVFPRGIWELKLGKETCFLCVGLCSRSCRSSVWQSLSSLERMESQCSIWASSVKGWGPWSSPGPSPPKAWVSGLFFLDLCNSIPHPTLYLHCRPEASHPLQP